MHRVHHNQDIIPAAFQNYFETNKAQYKCETRQRKDCKRSRTHKHWVDQMLKTKLQDSEITFQTT